MWRSVCNRASVKKLKSFADKSNFRDTYLFEKPRQLELHPYRHPSYGERGFRRINVLGDSGFTNLGVSLGLLHRSYKGYASSAAAEEIVSTEEEDSDEIREMVHHLNKEIKAVETKTNSSDHKKQPRLVNGIGQGKYIALRRRQIKIETEAWENAAKEYQELLVDMCEQKLAPNLPYVKSLFLGWFEPLKNAIASEQDLCREGRNRGAYAPQFDQLPADMMTIITMHKLMGLLMTGGGQGGARVVQAALHIGEAVEHEARIHRFMEKSKRKASLNESPDDDSETVNNEQQLQKLRKKVTNLVKKKKLQQVRHIVKQQDQLKPWGQDAQVKVGSRLIQLLMETAYIQPPVDQCEDCPPDIRPAFVHTLKTVETLRGSRRYGVIECDPLVRKGLEKSTTLTALGEMFESARSIMNWLGDCAKVIAVKNNPVQWTTPLGLPVVQPYRKLGRHLIKTSLQVLTLQRETDKVMVKRQRTTFPPNFVHSLDGSHMMMTAIACKEACLSFQEAYESAMVAKFGDDTSCQPLLDNETWCDVSGGVKKGRIYGFGSVSDPASFLEGTSSTITSQEVVYECIRNEMRGEMDAKAAEMEAKHQQMREEMDAKAAAIDAKQQQIDAKYEAMEKMYAALQNMMGN